MGSDTVRRGTCQKCRLRSGCLEVAVRVKAIRTEVEGRGVWAQMR
jgi:hypothetical protein